MSSTDSLTWGADGMPLVGFGVLALVLGLIWWIQWRAARRAELAAAGPLGRLLDVAPIARDVLRAVLVVVAAIMLVVAIARPRWGAAQNEVKALGVDIAFVVDASKSMLLTDVVPERIGAAKLEIHRLLDAMHGGRAAFVPFAGLAFEQTGLTGDFAVVKADLDGFRVEDMPRGGTAIGRGLVQALATLSPEERPANAPPADDYEKAVKPFEGAKHKAIVLFTDGEDHEGDALAAADEAAKRGIKVFAVGVGTPQGRPVVEVDDQGRVTGTVKGPDGVTPIFSSLNVKLLKDIAAKTGGDYFLLGPDGLGDGLLKALGDLEKAEYSTVYQDLSEERFEWAALPAVVLLALELWLSGRKKRRAIVVPTRRAA